MTHTTEPVWTLAYEAEGTEYAAWTLRYGVGADTTVYETTDAIAPDTHEAARDWAAKTLIEVHDVLMQDWVTHRGDNSPGFYWEAVPVAPFDSAEGWASALDAYQEATGLSVGEMISQGYATGQLVGITLDPRHPDAHDERGVIASDKGWVVRYDHSNSWWEAVPQDNEPDDTTAEAQRLRDANDRAWEVVKLLRLRSLHSGKSQYADPTGQMLSAALVGDESHDAVRREIEELEKAARGSEPDGSGQ